MSKKIYEKIKLFRLNKGWTQEEAAERLNMSPSGYGSIERGDTDVGVSRLEKIAEVLDVDIGDLFDSGERKIFNFGGTQSNHDCQNQYSNLSPEQMRIKYEFEKQQLIIEKLGQENTFLKQENACLKELIAALKKNG